MGQVKGGSRGLILGVEKAVKRIRVLHVIKNFNLGGAETNLLNLIKASDPAKLELHVAFSGGGEIEQRFRQENLNLFQYATSDHKIGSVATFGIVSRIARYLRTHQIDVVHTHNFNAHVWGSLAAKWARKKLVEHVHDYRYLEVGEFHRRKGEVSQFRFIRYFKRWPDRVIVLTHQNVDYLLSHGYGPVSRIREIRNGIPMKTSEPADPRQTRLSLGLDENDRVILTPARVSPEKNIELVLRIAPHVVQEVPRARFVISGEGPQLVSLKAAARMAGLEKSVVFTGYRPDIQGLLAVADVFLLPSFLELHSIAILEALSMGVPVVVSRDVGCNSDVLRDGYNAFLLDPFSSVGWAETLVRLLKDEELRRMAGQRGYELCRKEFDIANVADKFEDLYQELVTKDGG